MKLLIRAGLALALGVVALAAAPKAALARPPVDPCGNDIQSARVCNSNDPACSFYDYPGESEEEITCLDCYGRRAEWKIVTTKGYCAIKCPRPGGGTTSNISQYTDVRRRATGEDCPPEFPDPNLPPVGPNDPPGDPNHPPIIVMANATAALVG